MNNQQFEERKLGFEEKELDLKFKELELRVAMEVNRSTLKSPFGVAVVGGIFALLSGVFGNIIQGCNSTNVTRLQNQALVNVEEQKYKSNSKLEQQKQEQKLIFRALETGGDNNKARENLQFLVSAGLIADKITFQDLIDKAIKDPSIIPSISPPTDIIQDDYRFSINPVTGRLMGVPRTVIKDEEPTPKKNPKQPQKPNN